DDILRHTRKRPFEPFRIHLTDGTRYDVRHPVLVLVGERFIVVGLPRSDASAPLIERYETAALMHIVRLEPIDLPASPPGGTPAYCAGLRERVGGAGMCLEGIIRLPRARNDVERFERELETARACGAEVLRTALLDGRRYETFRTAEEFQRFRARSREALTL